MKRLVLICAVMVIVISLSGCRDPRLRGTWDGYSYYNGQTDNEKVTLTFRNGTFTLGLPGFPFLTGSYTITPGLFHNRINLNVNSFGYTETMKCIYRFGFPYIISGKLYLAFGDDEYPDVSELSPSEGPVLVLKKRFLSALFPSY